MQAVARACLRAQKLEYFGEYLMGLEEPLLRWNASRKCLEAICTESEEGVLPKVADTYTRQLSAVSSFIALHYASRRPLFSLTKPNANNARRKHYKHM